MRLKQSKRAEGWLVFNLGLILAFQYISSEPINLKIKNIQNKKEAAQYEVTVTLKLVQVYVMDKKGHPITDLEKSDFQLFDNGKQVKITDFERHILSLPGKKIKAIEPFDSHQADFRMNRKFFLFFDFAFNSGAGIMKSKRAALDFIDTKVLPTDEVGILSYSSKRGLTLHEYLTNDHKKVREIVGGIGLKEVLGRAEDVEGKYWEEIEKIAAAQGGEAGSQFLRMAAGAKEFDRKNYKAQVSNFSSEVKDIAKALRYIPGQKHIIFFSSGVSNFILYGKVADLVETREERRGDSVLRKKYEEMGKELSASNSPVYAVNAAGLASAHFKSTDFLGTHSLKQLTEISGGIYFDNINNYKEIMERIQKLTNVYYVLGYYIDEKWDGRYHDLKVKVKRKGCTIYGQGGYFNPKPFNEYTKTEKMLHLIDLALSEKPQLQDPLHFPSVAIPCLTKQKTCLVSLSKIPRNIKKEFSGKKSEIVTLVFDSENNIADLKRDEINLSDSPENHSFFYSITSLVPGEYNCRTIIRNLETGKGAVAHSSVVLPEVLKSDLKIFPPLLLIPETNIHYFRSPESGTKEKEMGYISLVDLFPFNFTQYAPVVGDINKGISKLVCIVRCSTRNVPVPAIDFSIYLVDLLSGERIDLCPSALHQFQKEELQIYTMELPIENIQPGKYVLHIIGKEMKSGLKSHTSSLIEVK